MIGHLPQSPIGTIIDRAVVLDSAAYAMLPEVLIAGVRGFAEASESGHFPIVINHQVRRIGELLYGLASECFPDRVVRPFDRVTVNKNMACPYHYDDAIEPRALVCILTLSRNVSGGMLVCPDLDLTFASKDRSLAILPGREVMHGVTPIIYNGHDSYRASLVYYRFQQ